MIGQLESRRFERAYSYYLNLRFLNKLFLIWDVLWYYQALIYQLLPSRIKIRRWSFKNERNGKIKYRWESHCPVFTEQPLVYHARGRRQSQLCNSETVQVRNFLGRIKITGWRAVRARSDKRHNLAEMIVRRLLCNSKCFLLCVIVGPVRSYAMWEAFTVTTEIVLDV